MPAWLLAIVKMLIQYGGPMALSWALSWLKAKYPEWAKVIEDLIKELQNPEVSNSAARKKAIKRCDGIGCAPDLKKVD